MGTKSSNPVFGHGRLQRYVPLVLCVAVILFFSTGEASMMTTSRFVRPVLEFLFPNADEATLELYHAWIRKIAHLAEYAVLAMVAARAYNGSSKRMLSESFWAAVMVTVLGVATIDEFNQSLNPARTGSFYDVLIDLTGGLIGLALYFLVFRIFRRKPNLAKAA